MKNSLRFYNVFFILICFAPMANSATVYVTDNSDSGPGSLREAIAYSNTTTAIQTIEILVSSTIDTSQTYHITSPVIINGHHNTISATYLSYPDSSILKLESGSNGSVIRNLVLTNAISTSGPAAGVEIVDSDFNTVAGCVIGTNWLGEEYKKTSNAIYLNNAHHNYLGGHYSNGNILSGNDNAGISLYNSCWNLIAGNIIGLTPDQSTALRNYYEGIYLRNNSDHNQIGLPQDGYHNIISGNGKGILISSSRLNKIQNNLIGINDANQMFPTQNTGIYINSDANLIGGTTGFERNIISGNGSSDIYFQDQAFGNTVVGNYIGTSIDGTQILSPPVSYSTFKINLYGADGNFIGLKESGVGNLVRGGDYGIYMVGTCLDNGLFGNLITNFSSQGIALEYSSYYYCYTSSYAPVITYAHTDHIWGTAAPGEYIEIFRSPFSGGSDLFLGYTYADNDGDWSLLVTGLQTGDRVVALSTGSNNYGNTSLFSSPVIVDNTTDAPQLDVAVNQLLVLNNMIRRHSSGFAPCTLRWQQANDAPVTVRILDENGHIVRTLACNLPYTKNQIHELEWDTLDQYGNKVASGLYFAHVQSQAMKTYKKILVLDR